MSLLGALNVGKTALAVTQASLQVTGNNIANAGNPDYARQTAGVTSTRDQRLRPGMFIGTGVDLSAITRQIDEALASRLRGAVSDDAGAEVTQQWLSRVESVFNELSDEDLSTSMSTFFKSWSNLANKPQDNGLRQVAIQAGQSLAEWFQDVRNQLSNLQGDVNNRLSGLANDANGLAQQIADLNGQIVQAEGGSGGGANGLRDQRDALLKQLSQLMDVKTVQQPNGVMNVFVGSEPLVMNADNRGVMLKTEIVNNVQTQVLSFARDGGTMSINGGQLGALTGVRAAIDEVAARTDSLAHNLIFELNKIHSAGQGLAGFASVTAINPVDDTTAALNSSDAGLKFTPVNGSFVVHVKDTTTGQTTSTLVKIDLDGLNSNDTTLDSLIAELNTVAGVNASLAGGKLAIRSTAANTELQFSQDSSGTLAALGINTFFTGSTAADIAIHQTIKSQPRMLAVARNGEPADNQTALAIAALQDKQMNGLDGLTLKSQYEAMINEVAVSSANAKTNAEAAKTVLETLNGQREALSGVSLDEEAINLMRQQRAFQGAAKLISAIDELMRTLLSMT